jgi:hypothetical protein
MLYLSWRHWFSIYDVTIKFLEATNFVLRGLLPWQCQWSVVVGCTQGMPSMVPKNLLNSILLATFVPISHNQCCAVIQICKELPVGVFSCFRIRELPVLVL